MTRVTENSSLNSINYSVNKTKSKVEDLQLKGSNLKRVQKPSDDPVGNVNILAVRSQNIDAEQYIKNINYAKTNLSYTETVLEELTDILVKAKELAIGQSSDIYNPEVRESVSKEIGQLYNQALSIANKRIGNRYLFSGQKVLTKPFNENGQYLGDTNKIFIEVNKDVFIPVNMTGKEIFFDPIANNKKQNMRLESPDNFKPMSPEQMSRQPASIEGEQTSGAPIQSSIFEEIRSLENALLTNNPDVIQSLLEKLDTSIDRTISYRSKIGALTNSISNSETQIEKLKLMNEEYRTKIEDADVTELFSNLQKEQNVLKATYQSSSTLMNTSLLDFLR
jgi:flagellar hook-associated protein 3 FlgL